MAAPIDLTGEKFGMLTVVRKADKDGRYIAWYCDCECGTTDFIVRGSDLKKKLVKSCGCKDIKDINLEEKRKAKSKAKKNVKHMSEQEKLDWDELYQYVRTNIMGYDQNQALSNSMALRLKGLLTNKFMENNNVENTANYSYNVILNTFKYSYLDIQKALNSMNFVDEQHKFNVVLKIVEKNINTVYMRMKNVKRAKEEIESVNTTNMAEYVNTFKGKEKKKNNKLDELW